MYYVIHNIIHNILTQLWISGTMATKKAFCKNERKVAVFLMIFMRVVTELYFQKKKFKCIFEKLPNFV